MAKKTHNKNDNATSSNNGVSNGVKAELRNYNQSPRKVRLVTNLVKGKSVEQALDALSFLPKRAADPVRKLIQSALANASAGGGSASGGKAIDISKLIVKNIAVDADGMTVRYMPRAQGRATPIRRRKSRVAVTLAI